MQEQAEVKKDIRQSESVDSFSSKQTTSKPVFADPRPLATAQRRLIAMADGSPRAMQHRAMQHQMNESPRMTAQRQHAAGVFGPAVQERRAEDSPAREASPNSTGLPDSLKSGVESLSGISMDHVKVHYNSAQPAQLNALAFAQGNDIHVGPGQERHLPHEAWHVVQQAQGRVLPTMQMKQGISINDDRSLEQEADVMGARADEAGRTVIQNKQAEDELAPLAQFSAGAGGPHQLKIAIVIAPNVGHLGRPPLYEAVGANPDLDGLFGEMRWHLTAEEIYLTIDGARPLIDDDDAVDYLDGKERETDLLVGEGNKFVLSFNKTEPNTRSNLADEFKAIRTKLMLIAGELHQSYRVSTGTFSAKGRATDTRNAVVHIDNKYDNDADNTFMEGITIDGVKLSNRVNVKKSKTEAEPGVIRIKVLGESYDEDDRDAKEREQLAEDIDGELDDLKDSDGLFKGEFTAAGRGKGQESGMEKTNARGYAWATKTKGWKTTQWEWLHVRGASLGGATDGRNLVLGTRDSNTHMMPFESNLKSLARLAGSGAELRYKHLDVEWSTDGENYGHSFDTIKIKWKLEKKDNQPGSVKEPEGTAEFSPLKVGSVLSKNEVAYLEHALQRSRDGEMQHYDD
jgi:hypothetical protein